jgi:hypothetical protein
MPLRRLLQTEVGAEEGGSFAPEDIARMTAAYEGALELLRLKDRTDPVKELIAQKIIEITRNGEREPRRICVRALNQLGLPLSD